MNKDIIGMKMSTKRKVASILAIILCIIMCLTIAMSMVGCGSTDQVELSDEARERVEEYASGLILKYGVDSSRLLEEDEIAESEAEKRARVNAHASEYAHANGYIQGKPKEEEKEDAKGKGKGGKKESDGEENPKSYDVTTIQDFYGINGFSIDFSGVELADSYLPEGDEVNMGFLVTADAGRKLAILHFSAKNTGAEDAELDMTAVNPTFRVAINDGGSHPTMETLLINDMTSYKGMVIAGGSQELVLIAQTDDGFTGSEATRAALTMKDQAGKSANILLKNGGSGSVAPEVPSDGGTAPAAPAGGAEPTGGSAAPGPSGNGGTQPESPGGGGAGDDIPEEGPDVPVEDIVPQGVVETA